MRSVIKADGTRINVERDEKGRVRRVITAANPGNATGPLGKLSAHAPAIQVDMDDPNIDWGDPLVIDVWGRYWRVLPLSGGLLGDSTLIAPIESADSAGGGGGGGAIGAGGGSKTREQCIMDELKACDYQLASCYVGTALPGGVTAAIACVAATLPTLVGAIGAGIACGTVILVLIAAGCYFSALACVTTAGNKCP